jgi:hypothetical protein
MIDDIEEAFIANVMPRTGDVAGTDKVIKGGLLGGDQLQDIFQTLVCV